jgi:hypothetical protein
MQAMADVARHDPPPADVDTDTDTDIPIEEGPSSSSPSTEAPTELEPCVAPESTTDNAASAGERPNLSVMEKVTQSVSRHLGSNRNKQWAQISQQTRPLTLLELPVDVLELIVKEARHAFTVLFSIPAEQLEVLC